ncbi:HAD family hydrolase [Methanoculleus chikugoensis]|uniref:HAD family hydrolase n=1 Tax=Methanoculleus chikugoensis TaxID=118126 RepID=UPI000A9196F9|nr:HAD family hydrolase [Methanoculleus chikugoensis]
MLTVPYVEGAEELLRDCSQRIPLYIVSATPPEGEMQEIAQRRNLTKYFVRIYGSPKMKAECIREILLETSALPDEALFVGDAPPNDWDAARATGVRFVARIPPGDPNRFTDGREWRGGSWRTFMNSGSTYGRTYAHPDLVPPEPESAPPLSRNGTARDLPHKVL